MRKHERLAQSAAASLPRRTYTSDLSANANLGCWKPPGRCQEVTPDLVVFRQEVFDDFLSHEPVILRRSGRMDLDNRPIGPPTRVSGGLTARGTVQTVACKNCGHYTDTRKAQKSIISKRGLEP